MKERTLQHIAYERYKLLWMIRYGKTALDLAERIIYEERRHAECRDMTYNDAAFFLLNYAEAKDGEKIRFTRTILPFYPGSTRMKIRWHSFLRKKKRRSMTISEKRIRRCPSGGDYPLRARHDRTKRDPLKGLLLPFGSGDGIFVLCI